MIEINEDYFEVPDGEFFEKMKPVIEEVGEQTKGKRAYDFFVSELMTALDNIAKNSEAASWNAGLGGSVHDYYYLKGKAEAFREIYERVAKEYGLAYNYKLRPEISVQKPVHEYIDKITEKVLPWDRCRGRRDTELLRRKLSMAMSEAMYEAYNMGKIYSFFEELDKQTNDDN